MKKLVLSSVVVLSVIALLVLFSSTAIAAQADKLESSRSGLVKEMTTLLKSDKALEKEFDLNEAKRPRLEQRKSDLEWSAKMVEKEINKWNAESARIQKKINNYESDVAAHNSRCDRTVSTQAEYDACVRSKNALDSRKSTLQGEINYQNEWRGRVQGIIDTQMEQEQALQREIDEYNRHRQELIDAGVKIQARLDEIRSYLTDCEEAIAAYDASPNPMQDGTMERMKAVCGQMFDGN